MDEDVNDEELSEPAEALLVRAVRCVAAGGIIGFPTDTVYGIGCAPNNRDAIQKIYALKKREASKPLILLVADIADLEPFLAAGDTVARAAARQFLPGPLTLVVERPAHVPREVTAGGESVGLRVPADTFCRSLLKRTGPLATTSANLSGGLAYAGVEEVELPAVDIFIDRGSTTHGKASSVIDFRTAPPRMIREGALDAATFEAWYTAWLSEQSVQ